MFVASESPCVAVFSHLCVAVNWLDYGFVWRKLECFCVFLVISLWIYSLFSLSIYEVLGIPVYRRGRFGVS